MNIAIIVPALVLKAPVTVAFDLANGFVLAGHSVKVFYFDRFREIEFPCPTEQISIYDFEKLDGFDLIHSHMLRPDIFAWCCKKLRRNTARFVTTIHNIVEEDLQYNYGKITSMVFSRLWRAVWNGLDGRVVLTDQALSYYNDAKTSKCFKRIYNGRSPHSALEIAYSDIGLIQNIKSKWYLIGACAVVARRKGLEQVIAALPFLPRHAFLLIGDGPALVGLLEYAKSLGVADRFISLGRKSNPRDYLPYFDVYAMPSRSEGLPLALLEAVSANIPTICSDIPQFKEVFSESEAAYFSLDDVSSFISAIERITSDGGQLQSRAHRRFSSCYTQDVMVRNYLVFFEKILNRA